MLKSIRYIAISLSILAHFVLAVLAAGNITHGHLTGIDVTVNAWTCIFGLLTVIFLSIITFCERSQKELTTTSVLFESAWVALVWTVDVTLACLVSTTVPRCLTEPQSVTGKWDVCIAFGIIVPFAWFSAIAVTAHAAVLILLIQWHRFSSPSRPAPPLDASLPTLKARVRELVLDEMFIMGPIISRSAYSLLQSKDTFDIRGHLIKKHRLVPVPYQLGLPKDNLYPDLEDPFKVWPGGRKFCKEAPQTVYSEAPPSYLTAPLSLGRHETFSASVESLITPIVAMYGESPRSATDSLPRIQLRDEPAFEIVGPPRPAPARPQPAPVRSRTRQQRQITRPPRLSFLSFQSSTSASTSSPSTPRLPTRSRTLPTLTQPATPPAVRYAGGGSTPDQPPALSRSRTLGTIRRHVPSRYAQIDLVAAGYL